MDPQVIKDLIDSFGSEVLSWNPGEKDGGRFVVRANPLPPLGEIFRVIADIQRGLPIQVKNGKVVHWPGCEARNHDLKKKTRMLIERAVERLEDQRFVLVIEPGKPEVLGNQPIVTSIEPMINYQVYPDHPHLGIMGEKWELPDSLCYIEDPSLLGADDFSRLDKAIGTVIIWLFRHQLWVATREFKPAGEWIGPQCPRRDPKYFPGILNPLGICHCGSGKAYEDCHMVNDIARQRNVSLDESKIWLPRYRGAFKERNDIKTVRFNQLKKDIG